MLGPGQQFDDHDCGLIAKSQVQQTSKLNSYFLDSGALPNGVVLVWAPGGGSEVYVRVDKIVFSSNWHITATNGIGVPDYLNRL
jgi:hypothetical protein